MVVSQTAFAFHNAYLGTVRLQLSIQQNIQSPSGRTYLVIEQLSAGEMGNAYRVVSEGSIFFFKPHTDAEARLLANIYHPTFPQWVESVSVDGEMYAIYSWRSGLTAEALGKIEPKWFTEIAIQLLKGLALLHEHGFLHGDITANNILVDLESAVPTVSLIDFGLASKRYRHRIGDAVSGTPGWFAPERFEETTVDSASDLYALGLVLKRAFDLHRLTESEKAWLERVASEQPRDRFSNAREALRWFLPDHYFPCVYPEQISRASQIEHFQEIWKVIHPTLFIDETLSAAAQKMFSEHQEEFFESLYVMAYDEPFLEPFADRLSAFWKFQAQSVPRNPDLDRLELEAISTDPREVIKKLRALENIDRDGNPHYQRLLAVVLYRNGELDEALKNIWRARKVARTSKSSLELIRALNLSGAIYQQKKRYFAAVRSYRSSLKAASRAGERLEAAKAHFNIAVIEQLIGHIAVAEEAFEQCTYLFRSRGTQRELAHALIQFSQFKLTLGQFDAAKRLLDESKPLLQQNQQREEKQRETYLADIHFESGATESFLECVERLSGERGMENFFPRELAVLKAQSFNVARQPELALRELRETFGDWDHDAISPIFRSATVAGIHSEIQLGTFQPANLAERFSSWCGAPPAGEMPISFLMDRYRLLVLVAPFGDAPLEDLKKVTKAEMLHFVSDAESTYLEQKCSQVELRYGQLGAPAEESEMAHTTDQGFPVEKLLEVTARLIAGEDPKAILEIVLAGMLELASAERGFILAREKKAIRVAAQIPNSKEGPLELSFSVAKETLETGEAFYTPDASRESRLARAPSVRDFHLRGIAAFPLRAKGETVATIYLDHPGRVFNLTENQRLVLQHLADQAAVVWQTAKLSEGNRNRSKRIEILNAQLQEMLVEKERKMLELQARIPRGPAAQYPPILRGQSTGIQKVRSLIERAVEHDVSVLICGEDGTGKAEVAKHIHQRSRRSEAPIVRVDCATIPLNLIEAELVGYAQGAFTGAYQDSIGLLRSAGKGTVVLERIQHLSSSAQALLSSILATKQVRPVGSTETFSFEARILVTMNVDPELAVKEETLRSDLYFTLASLVIKVPSLRDRKRDLPQLLSSVLIEIGSLTGKKNIRITQAALNLCEMYAWPGNLPQVRSELERALVIANDEIDVQHLSDEIRSGSPTKSFSKLHSVGGGNIRETVAQMEYRMIETALVQSNGNTLLAAKKLGIPRTTLYDRMRRVGLTPKGKRKS